MRLNMNDNKLRLVKELVKEYVDMTGPQIEDFIDGGDEGWDNGDEDQQDWIDNANANEIADWVIAGYVPQEA